MTMRRQTGTTSLRAMLYMDEIAGYFPPVASPPSKAPLLTLLKQGARTAWGSSSRPRIPSISITRASPTWGPGFLDVCRRSATRRGKVQTALSFGATLLGALFGRKAASVGTIGRATTAARGVGRSMKEAADVKRAAENVETVRSAIAGLEEEIAADMAAVAARFEEDTPLEPISVGPKRGQVEVQFVALAWIPAT